MGCCRSIKQLDASVQTSNRKGVKQTHCGSTGTNLNLVPQSWPRDKHDPNFFPDNTLLRYRWWQVPKTIRLVATRFVWKYWLAKTPHSAQRRVFFSLNRHQML